MRKRTLPLEIDHVLVFTSCGGPEADALKIAGLVEGTPNAHPGQGTACRRFFFRNAYLELLWVNNPAEAQSPAVRWTHLLERWTSRDQGACPIGIGFRPGTNGGDQIPFPAREYRPPYLPDTWSLQIATNASVLSEPLLFFLPFGRRPDSHNDRGGTLAHPVGVRELTRVELHACFKGKPSAALEGVFNTGLVRRGPGTEPFAELGFDQETKGQAADLRPTLPLRLCW